MKNKSLLFLLGVPAVFLGIVEPVSAAAVAPPFSATQISKYLMVGTKKVPRAMPSISIAPTN